jgi:hypothetical protein
MTQLKSLLKNLNSAGVRSYFSEQYLTINAVFAGVILVIMGYSILFSPDANNYPVVCIHERLTGFSCPSCGLSHSFSLIVRGKLDEALIWNSFGLRIFIFFFAQLLMRIGFSVNYIKYPDFRKNLIILDIMASIGLLLISFYPFIRLLFM